jgi:hypothetical protein
LTGDKDKRKVVNFWENCLCVKTKKEVGVFFGGKGMKVVCFESLMLTAKNKVG